MSDKTNESLSAFMKKQISEKSSKNNLAKKSTNTQKDNNQEIGEDQEDIQSAEEEMTEEEQLEEAKKASRNKAAERDQTEMFKKLIMESISKYAMLISGLVILSIGVIKFGPELLKFLNGLIFRVLMGSLGG